MTDQQIAPGAGPTPVAITVQGSEQLMPKLAFASYDGSGAAGDFLPVIRFIGPGGQLAGQAVGDVVTAGASVDQTWFRGLAKLAATGAPNLAWARADVALATAVPAGVTAAGYFNLATNDAATYDLAGAPLQRFRINKVGAYLLHFGFRGATPNGGPVANPWTTVLQGGPSGSISPVDFRSLGGPDAIGSSLQTWETAYQQFFVVDAAHVGGNINFNWNNTTGVQLNSVSGGIVCIRVGDEP